MTLPNDLNLNELCKQILKVDNSIRFAGIANMKGKLVAEVYREGLVPFLTKQETEVSALESIVRMATRQRLEEKKLGKTIYAFTLYQKIKRATIPLGNNNSNDNNKTDYVLLVSFDLAAEIDSIILNKILPIVKNRR